MKLKILLVSIGVIIAAGSIWYIFNGGKDTTSSDTSSVAESNTDSNANQSDSLLNLINKQKDSKTFATLLEASGIGSTLQAAGSYTVFAPTDAAFDALPEGLLDSLQKPENKEQLADLLRYHIVKGSLAKDSFENEQKLPTLANNDVVVRIDNGTIYIVDMKASQAKLLGDGSSAANGILYSVTSVLLPQ